MFIECPHQKVKDLRIENEVETGYTGGFLIKSRVLKVTRGSEEIDPFESYYRAAREKIARPHYVFANMQEEADLIEFYRQYGFPYYEGHTVRVRDVLIQAKRLRLAMEACGAFRDGKTADVQRIMGEWRFALRWDADWFYWPDPLYTAPDDKTRKQWEDSRDRATAFLSHSRQCDLDWAAELVDPKKVLMHLHGLLHETCREPMKQIDLTPSVQLLPSGRRSQRQATLSWYMRPVHYRGEMEHAYGTSPVEEPMLGAPYGLMYLLDLSHGTETRVCADRSCMRVFGANRPDQMFCGYLCAHRSAVRRSRSRRRPKRRKHR